MPSSKQPLFAFSGKIPPLVDVSGFSPFEDSDATTWVASRPLIGLGGDVIGAPAFVFGHYLPGACSGVNWSTGD